MICVRLSNSSGLPFLFPFSCVTFSRQSTHSTFSFVLVYPLCHPSKQKISEHNYSIDDDECPPPRSTFAFPVSMNLLFERSYCQRTWIHNFASQINSIDSLSMHVCRAKLGKGDRERFFNFSSAVTAGVSKSLPSSRPLSSIHLACTMQGLPDKRWTERERNGATYPSRKKESKRATLASLPACLRPSFCLGQVEI
jgi:hypothetical protein